MGNWFSVRRLVWALTMGLVAVAGYSALGTPEPARSGLELVAALCETNADAAGAIERHLAESLSISARDPELAVLEGVFPRPELARRFAQFHEQRPACSASLEDWSMSTGPEGLVWLEGVLQYSDSQPGDLHAQRRKLRGAFRQVNGGWQLEKVFIGLAERHDPEARP